MRKNLMVAAGVLAIGISSAAFVRAEGRAVAKDSAVAFRLAATTPTPGFQKMTTESGETVYVSPRVTFTSDEIVSAMTGEVRGDLNIALTPDAAQRIDRTAGDRLAVLVNGKVTTTARIGQVGRDNVSVAGLSDRELSRLSSLLNVGNAYGSIIRVVPQQSHAKPGDLITVDAFVMGTPVLRTFQVGLAVVGGRTGTLSFEPGHIDKSRSDFVFGSAQSINAVDDTHARFGGTLMSGTVDATAPRYVGSFDLRVSNDASGTFLIKVRMDGDSFLLNENGGYIRVSPMNASIKVGVGGARNAR